MPPAHPYIKGTRVWLPDPQQAWSAGEITAVDNPSNVDTAESDDVYITLHIKQEQNPDVEIVQSFPLSVLVAAGQNQLVPSNAAATSPATTTTTTATPGVGSGAGSLVGKDDDGKPVILPPLRNPPLLEQTDDLSNLSNLNEPSVLHAISTRYDMHLPYTYSGIVLVALNPFSPLNIYGQDMINQYAGKKKGELEPHLFAIAEEALDYMRRGNGTGGKDNTGAGDQTIIVSGESGAGKTVSAKFILRYFASVEDPSKPAAAQRKRLKASGSSTVSSGSVVGEDGMSETERQILASNPIMEAFGNAKTTRNDNSSRFGKYIEILFNPDHEIVGARIRTYLLERSRLVYQPESERNYHIFYQLLAGAPAQERKEYGIDLPHSSFAYLAGGGPTSTPINGVDDAEEFKITQKALSTVGISIGRQWEIFRLLAGLLHLGNVKISPMRNEATIDTDDQALESACQMLGVDKDQFRKWTLKKQLTTRSEKIVTNLSAPQANVVRDSVAKFIYSCLFEWLVSIINNQLAGEGGRGAKEAKKFIGVLDIYGFEHFKKNSFEQFCINWANEKLQQEFNAHVFKLEQEEYMREEINWTFIDFADNQMCIDVIEGKMGILSLLDEESRLPAGADNSFAAKIHSTIVKPEQKQVFKKPRFNQNAFTIAHYAHDVTYDVDGFLEKNRDTVPDEHLELLMNSENTLVKECLEAALAAAQASKENMASAAKANNPATAGAVTPGVSAKSRAGGAANSRKPTLGSIFKYSLVALMDTINNTNVHYIRCIKPNEEKRAWELDSKQVLAQLRACGVLETIRISCAGYPSRWTFAEFAERYLLLVNSTEIDNAGVTDIRALCSQILEKTIPDTDKYQIGLTKIFFRAGMLASMESMRAQKLNELVTLVQKNYRRHVALKEYRAKKSGAIKIQTAWRGYAARKLATALKKERAAVMLQTAIRGWLARREYVRTRQAVIKIQAAVRGHQQLLRFREARKERAALVLQSIFRGMIVRKHYKQQIKRIVLIQSLYRRRLARKQLVVLKSEAKSATRFKEISYKLENKVVELTQTLQLRSGEKKALQERLNNAEEQIRLLATKHADAETKVKDLALELDKPTVPKSEYEQLLVARRELESQITAQKARIAEQDAEIQRHLAMLQAQTESAREKQSAADTVAAKSSEDLSTISSLRAELAALKEQINRQNALQALTRNQRSDPPLSPTGPALNNGLRALENGDIRKTPSRSARHHSVTGPTHEDQDTSRDSADERMLATRQEIDQSVRPVTMGYPADISFEEGVDALMALLENEESLDLEVLQVLIKDLKPVQPSLNNAPAHNEVMFPAHIICLISNEMWKYGMIGESERFLANVMQSIQQHIMSLEGEDVIIPGFFWLTNVHEILSFVMLAEEDAMNGIGPGAENMGREFNWVDYEKLVTIVKHDLDSLEYNIYHTAMQQIKRKLAKMVIPALIETQALPGFVERDSSNRLLGRMLGMQAPSAPAFSMDNILDLLNKVWKAMKSYYVETSVIQQVFSELLKLIGVSSFNDLLMRRNFCSWKRAMQIQYNITRIEEWCKSHDMQENLIQLESLMQATKLLQLKKASAADIDILFDVCWILSPSQIQKLIGQYHTADYEAPIPPEIVKLVAQRVNVNDKGDHLLLPPETDEAGP
ncbi:hypothetical protein QFC24_005436 [Naganishia onofrii]|uniref:Uncharacterized protein n=1 Tax=Naganishia onofrii TaxID=1851511 RepID=A0ACC2X854_9TREE|nr:hypothetical protein QFC24_005436 [Naganishia onofrii]